MAELLRWIWKGKNMMLQRILCEDSVEGIFTGVYDIYEKKYDRSCIELKVPGNNENYQLFTTEEVVETDIEKAKKVANTIKKRFGTVVYDSLLRVAFSLAEDKANVIFQTICYGITYKKDERLLENIAYAPIGRVFQINRQVKNETNRFIELARFEEVKGGVLFAQIEPEQFILPLLAPHFTDRLKNENFVIYDANRKMALIHERNKGWGIYENLDIKRENMTFEAWEDEIQELWKVFFHTIAIEERKNSKLQKNMLPLKFRKNMTEFM